MKMKNPKSVGDYRSEADDLTCAENQEELEKVMVMRNKANETYG